jgi:hypothetical protein
MSNKYSKGKFLMLIDEIPPEKNTKDFFFCLHISLKLLIDFLQNSFYKKESTKGARAFCRGKPSVTKPFKSPNADL